jgi:hypothetical protein
MKKTEHQLKRTFRFLSEAAVRRDYIDITPWQSVELRSRLPKGIYYLQPTEKGKIHWNIQLLQSYLVNGESQSHQALVDEYLATLPQAA